MTIEKRSTCIKTWAILIIKSRGSMSESDKCREKEKYNFFGKSEEGTQYSFVFDLTQI